MYVLLLASHWISVCLQGNHAFALWPRCLVCKIKEECFPASCFLGDWAGRVPSGGECCGSAKLAALLQCTHNHFIQHQFFMYSPFWVCKCSFLFPCTKLSANRSDPLTFFAVFLFCKLFSSSTYSPSYHAAKRETESAPGDFAGLENERQIYKSVLEGGDIPFQGLSGLKRPSSSASTKGRRSGS